MSLEGNKGELNHIGLQANGLWEDNVGVQGTLRVTGCLVRLMGHGKGVEECRSLEIICVKPLAYRPIRRCY